MSQPPLPGPQFVPEGTTFVCADGTHITVTSDPGPGGVQYFKDEATGKTYPVLSSMITKWYHQRGPWMNPGGRKP